MEVRSSVCAGRFFPADEDKLIEVIEKYLNEVEPTDTDEPPEMIVAPHAGYQFCGPVLGPTYSRLAEADSPETAFIFGPSHFEIFEGAALPPQTAFETPFGRAEIPPEIRSELLDSEYVVENKRAHGSEHSVETQVPFLQYLFPDVDIVPVVTGDISNDDLVDLIERAFKTANATVCISTDLSHFFDYDTACELDRETARIVENYEPSELDPDRACGFQALAAAITFARQNDLEVERYGLCNSGDTTDNRDRVVGYGGWGFY